MKVKGTHPMYDPLMYVPLFPFGDMGWEQENRPVNKKYTTMQYYKFRLIVHNSRLNFIRLNQSKLRADVYQGLADTIQNSDYSIDALENLTFSLPLHAIFIGKKLQMNLLKIKLLLINKI